MLAQVRPDIASATEQTVLNLKELETRIDALRADLAWLCQGLGHPEAARIAAAPTPGQVANVYAPGVAAIHPGFAEAQALRGWTGSGFPSSWGPASPHGPPPLPYPSQGNPAYAGSPHVANPFGASPYGTGPYATSPYATSPYATTPYATTPYATTPYATTPYATAPYLSSPYAHGYGVPFGPTSGLHAGGQAYGTVSAFNGPASPFFAGPSTSPAQYGPTPFASPVLRAAAAHVVPLSPFAASAYAPPWPSAPYAGYPAPGAAPFATFAPLATQATGAYAPSPYTGR